MHAHISVSHDGTFVCIECENEGKPLTNTEEGMVEADVDQIMADLSTNPNKVVYGVCSVCGMEYKFELHGDHLHLEPSDEEK